MSADARQGLLSFEKIPKTSAFTGDSGGNTPHSGVRCFVEQPGVSYAWACKFSFSCQQTDEIIM